MASRATGRWAENWPPLLQQRFAARTGNNRRLWRRCKQDSGAAARKQQERRGLAEQCQEDAEKDSYHMGEFGCHDGAPLHFHFP